VTVVLQELEVLRRHTALGLRFWDVATGAVAIDGLFVEVYPQARPDARSQAVVNRSGVYVCHRVAGLRDFEFDADTAPDAPWAGAVQRPYRVEVSDPQGRFQPMAFDAALPARGLSTWLVPWLSPPQPIVLPGDTGSPPAPRVGLVPLFSTPSRPLPDPLAVVYAQMREAGTERDAAWALLGVAIGGQPRGLGLADAQGRVAVMFPYPEPPRRPFASPPEARSDFGWSVELTPYWTSASPPLQTSAMAFLAAVLAQLSNPRVPLEAGASPSQPWRLDYRVPLTARSPSLAPPADALLYFAP